MSLDDWISAAVQVFGSPIVLGFLVLALGVVADYWIRQHFRGVDRKRDHSVRLNNEVLKPWSQVRTTENYEGIRSFWAEPPALSAEPRWRYACTHVEKACPEVWQEWSSTKASLVKENEQVPIVKKVLNEEITAALKREFGSSVTPIEAFDKDRVDICYLDYFAPLLSKQLQSILSGGTSKLEVRKESIGQAAHVGYKIIFIGTEVARVRRDADADPNRWEGVSSAILNSESLRGRMQDLVDSRGGTEAALQRFKTVLTETTQQIDQGLSLKGKCELGY